MIRLGALSFVRNAPLFSWLSLRQDSQLLRLDDPVIHLILEFLIGPQLRPQYDSLDYVSVRCFFYVHPTLYVKVGYYVADDNIIYMQDHHNYFIDRPPGLAR